MRTRAPAMLELVLPRGCGGCGAPGLSWCARCDSTVRAAAARGAVARLRPYPAGLPAVQVAGRYEGPARAALLAYKERGRRDLAPVLAGALAAAVTRARTLADPRRPLLVVAVPASRAGRRARGFDHVRSLVDTAPGLPRATPLLRWRRQVFDQAGLDRAHRAANLAYALQLPPGRLGRIPPDGAVLLVDDVVTTGATLGEAVRACARAGVRVAGAAALLATDTCAGDSTTAAG